VLPSLTLAGLVVLAAAVLLVVVSRQRWLPRGQEAGEEPPGEDEQDVIPFAKEPCRDFDLKVKMRGGRPDRLGTLWLHEEDEVAFEIVLSRDAYVGIWTIAPDQKTVTQVFPNIHEGDNYLRRDKVQTLPGRSTITAVAATGIEWAWVVAATQKWDPPRGQRDGPYFVFKTPEERQNFRDALRTLKPGPGIAKGNMLVAETLLRYRVTPRPSPGQK
jgi:hypothetical protein